MKKLFILITFISTASFIEAQKVSWRFQYGIKTSKNVDASVPYFYISDDYYNQTFKIRPLKTQYFSITRSQSINNRWDWTVGLNLTENGFIEKGYASDLSSYAILVVSTPTEREKKYQYLGAVSGFQLNILDSKKWHLHAESLLNSIIATGDYPFMKKLAWSTILSVGIERKVSEKLSLSLNPFCELPFSKFDKNGLGTTPSENPKNYFKPYSYGLMLEIKFKNRKTNT